MKNLKYLLLLCMTISLTVSCSSDDDNNDAPDSVHPLVGTWESSFSEDGISVSIEVTFNANNTGVMTSSATFNGFTESESENFTWSTDGNKLYMFDEEATYFINGDVLTINNEDGGLVLTRK